MPIISFFQTKGGTGKTTSAFVLAEILSSANSVTVIDADPNFPFQEWKNDGGEGEKFEIVTEEDLDQLPKAIQKASSKSAFVIIDNEGSRNQTAGRAIAMSDLVIITTNGGPLDNKHASKAIKYIRKVGKAAGRQIPFRILLTMQSPVAVSRTVKQGINNMADNGVPILDTPLIKRDAFMAIFGYNCTLATIDPNKVSEPMKGQFNARAFALEVGRILHELREQSQSTASTNKTKKTATKEVANA